MLCMITQVSIYNDNQHVMQENYAEPSDRVNFSFRSSDNEISIIYDIHINILKWFLVCICKIFICVLNIFFVCCVYLRSIFVNFMGRIRD